jgi:hypothetical protein
MAQRYDYPIALANMAAGNCPECGEHPDTHSEDTRFWLRWGCDLTRTGVLDRLAQYRADTGHNGTNDPGR